MECTLWTDENRVVVSSGEVHHFASRRLGACGGKKLLVLFKSVRLGKAGFKKTRDFGRHLPVRFERALGIALDLIQNTEHHIRRTRTQLIRIRLTRQAVVHNILRQRHKAGIGLELFDKLALLSRDQVRLIPKALFKSLAVLD